MNADDVKIVISKRTGIPITLLTGESIEEDIAKAKALLAYKRESDTERPKTTTREQFADWAQAALGIDREEPAGNMFADIEEIARREAGGYPNVKDGGSVNVNIGDGRTAKEQFADWAGKQFAYDPFKEGIWHSIP